MAIETRSAAPGTIDEATRFLYDEAALLDNNQLADWLRLLTADITYAVPVRQVRERGGGSGFSDRAFYMKESFGTLQTRIARLDSEFAWSESPPTRTRRFVSNIRIVDSADPADAIHVRVVSNLAVYCYRGDAAIPVVLTGERHDSLRRVDGTWLLAGRVVLLDTTVLGLQALSILL